MQQVWEPGYVSYLVAHSLLELYFFHEADPAGGTPVFRYWFTVSPFTWNVKNLDAANATGALRGIIKAWHTIEM